MLNTPQKTEVIEVVNLRSASKYPAAPTDNKSTVIFLTYIW